MLAFIGSPEFRALNVGFVLDEGLASASDEFLVFYAERPAWCEYTTFLYGPSAVTVPHKRSTQSISIAPRTALSVLHVHCPGSTGHGSLLLRDTAGEKVAALLRRFAEFRSAVVAQLAADPALRVEDVTTINLTQLCGGVQVNVVPPEMRVSFDVRLAVTQSHEEFEEMVL